MTAVTAHSPSQPHSRGWLLVSTGCDGVAHELYLRDGRIYVALSSRPLGRDGYRTRAGLVADAGRWPTVREEIMTQSCAGWTHEESADSLRRAARSGRLPAAEP